MSFGGGILVGDDAETLEMGTCLVLRYGEETYVTSGLAIILYKVSACTSNILFLRAFSCVYQPLSCLSVPFPERASES